MKIDTVTRRMAALLKVHLLLGMNPLDFFVQDVFTRMCVCV